MCRLFLCEIIKGFPPLCQNPHIFELVLGAVLGIFAVSATFLVIFPAFGLNLWSCFKRFRDYSSPRSAYYAINLL